MNILSILGISMHVYAWGAAAARGPAVQGKRVCPRYLTPAAVNIFVNIFSRAFRLKCNLHFLDNVHARDI